MIKNKDEYISINKEFKRRLVYRLGCDSGFFSEINNMLLAMIYCLEHSIQFELYSEKANYTKDGWLDFFEPFTTHHHGDFHQIYNSRPYLVSLPDDSIIREFNDGNGDKIDLLTQHVWGYVDDENIYNVGYKVESPYVEGALLDVAANIIDCVWKYNAGTREKIDEIMSSLNMPEQYAAIHIRRGDKHTEVPHTSLKAYIDKLDKIEEAESWPIFLASDDDAVVEEARVSYPDREFYHLHSPGQSGFSIKEFSALSNEVKYSQLITFLAEIELMRKSAVFIGTFTSNIGMFMGMVRAGKQTWGVDSGHWLNFRGANRLSVFMDRLFGHCESGFFLDIGAYDGLSNNYSHFFEHYRNWFGVCIDGSAAAIEQLNVNRKCIIRQAVIHHEASGYWTESGRFSGLMSSYDRSRIFDSFVRSSSLAHEATEVPCESLTAILQSLSIQSIDLCYINVMGAESGVLQSIDFSIIDISVFVISRAKDTTAECVFDFMQMHGYILIRSFAYELIFVKESAIHS